MISLERQQQHYQYYYTHKHYHIWLRRGVFTCEGWQVQLQLRSYTLEQKIVLTGNTVIHIIP